MFGASVKRFVVKFVSACNILLLLPPREEEVSDARYCTKASRLDIPWPASCKEAFSMEVASRQDIEGRLRAKQKYGKIAN